MEAIANNASTILSSTSTETSRDPVIEKLPIRSSKASEKVFSLRNSTSSQYIRILKISSAFWTMAPLLYCEATWLRIEYVWNIDICWA